MDVSVNNALGALSADPWLRAEESGPCCFFQCLNKKAVFLPAVCIIVMLFASTKKSICFRRLLLLKEAMYSLLILQLLFSILLYVHF